MDNSYLSSGPTESENEGSSLELRGLIHAVLRRVWLVILLSIALGVGAFVYVRQLPDQFESKAVVQIDPQGSAKITNEEARDQSDLRDPNVVETVMQNFRNRSLLESVGQKLKLASNAAFLRRDKDLPGTDSEVIDRLDKSLGVTARKGTMLVDITFRSIDPELSQKLTTALVEGFLRQNTETQMAAAEAQNATLVQKSAELRAKMERSAEAVQAYKNRVESVSMDTGRNLVESKLTNLNTNLSEARNERLKIESDLHLVQAVPDRDPAKLMAIASIAADAEVITAQAKVKDLETAMQALEDHYRAKHPRMIEAKNRLDEARAAVSAAVKAAPDRMNSRYDGAAASEQTLEKAVAAQEKELLRLDEKAVPYRALQQELEADRALSESVQKRLKESTAVMDIKPVNFRIVELASAPYRIKVQRLLYLIGGLVGGALLGIGLLSALYFLDASIKTVDDAERLMGLPVLSAVPTLKKTKTPAEMVALLSRPDSAVAEAFRSLRTALTLLGPATDRKVMLITSAVPGEGKTLTAGNIAVAFAQQGIRTVVLEADLRKPTLSPLFLDTSVKRKGISEFLIGETVVPLPTEIPNLFIMPAGGPPSNPAELLAGGRFAELIEMLKGQYDRVIIDTAPVNVVSDTLSIVSLARTIVLVVRNGSTPRNVVRRALELLRRAHARPDGLVLNFMPDWSGLNHHYYYSANTKYGGEGTYGTNYPTTPAAGTPAATEPTAGS